MDRINAAVPAPALDISTPKQTTSLQETTQWNSEQPIDLNLDS